MEDHIKIPQRQLSIIVKEQWLSIDRTVDGFLTASQLIDILQPWWDRIALNIDRNTITISGGRDMIDALKIQLEKNYWKLIESLTLSS